MIVKNYECLSKFIDITNTCINLRLWSSYFKTSTIVIISKPNKSSYDSPKFFYPIVLLNTLGKLFEKIISEWLQFHSLSNNFVLSQIRYSLVVILGLNSVSGVQYKDMMIDRWWKVLTEIIDVVKSEV